MSLTDADWAGLAALTETNRPEEQIYVLWVIRNRVESGRFGKGYEGVVLAPMQFSAFNLFTENRHRDEPSSVIFNAVARRTGLPSELLPVIHLAEKTLAADPLSSPFFTLAFGTSPDLKAAQAVCHYYSPVSMKPQGSAPAWAKSAKRLFTPPGINHQRFVFAEGVS